MSCKVPVAKVGPVLALIIKRVNLIGTAAATGREQELTPAATILSLLPIYTSRFT